jgi:FixJ family two-component response regulator
MSERPFVAVVDDSDSVRESLPDLLHQVGLAVQAFASAEAFLASDAAAVTNCLILDVSLPGMSGPDLQQELMKANSLPDLVKMAARLGLPSVPSH